jgi:hypothetical protein
LEILIKTHVLYGCGRHLLANSAGGREFPLLTGFGRARRVRPKMRRPAWMLNRFFFGEHLWILGAFPAAAAGIQPRGSHADRYRTASTPCGRLPLAGMMDQPIAHGDFVASVASSKTPALANQGSKEGVRPAPRGDPQQNPPAAADLTHNPMPTARGVQRFQPHPQ